MAPEDADVLSLECPHCGETFPSAIPMDPPTFATIRLESMLERCSACGHASRFSKHDYRFRSA
ncbi:MAG: hypothetical protein E6G58_03105 [Actinobacteria bacterium]|nr:MAG: hypothetical protein E6G58_03105 [Actinomycetota bacterium]